MSGTGTGRYLTLKRRKYEAVLRITLRHHLAYISDFLLRSAFLLFILYIFIQLWQTAFGGAGSSVVAGYTLKQIIWYLVFAEAITMACPQLCIKIEEEVKQGDIALRLIRPISYTGYHFIAYLGEAVLRFGVNLAAGSAIAWTFTGPPAFGAGWAGLAALAAGSFTVAFLLNFTIALCAFWVEETRGLEFVLQKLQFTAGGMLFPLEMMPDWLQRVCGWLPFQAVLYFPAKMVVAFDARLLVQYMAIQWAWAAALFGITILIYRAGVTKLNVNGG
jgi:ABC-2 type transport system permease protein